CQDKRFAIGILTCCNILTAHDPSFPTGAAPALYAAIHVRKVCMDNTKWSGSSLQNALTEQGQALVSTKTCAHQDRTENLCRILASNNVIYGSTRLGLGKTPRSTRCQNNRHYSKADFHVKPIWTPTSAA